MAVEMSRSQRKSLLEGATDGKYRKVRPNTEIIPGMGVEQVVQNRSHLPAWLNYDYADHEIPLSKREIPGA